MDKNQNDNPKQAEDMLKEKTNQDYNKQKPNPNDPNQKNENIEADMEEAKDKVKDITSTSSRKPIDLNSGDEGNQGIIHESDDQIGFKESGFEKSDSMQNKSRNEDQNNLKTSF